MKQWLYWKLTYIRDGDIPQFIVDLIDWIRDLLWEDL